MGLFLIMTEDGGVGTVAADFTIAVEGVGVVAKGEIRAKGTVASSSAYTSEGNATWIEEDPTNTVTLVGGAIETGVVGTS